MLPIHYAAMSGHVDVIRLFIDNGTNINDIELEGKWSVLHSAVCAGQGDVSEFLIETGAPVTIHNIGGLSPLHIAAHVGHGYHHLRNSLLREAVRWTVRIQMDIHHSISLPRMAS